MEKLIWFSDGVEQVDKLVLADGIRKLPTAFKTIDDFGLEEGKEYSLALVYHQTFDDVLSALKYLVSVVRN